MFFACCLERSHRAVNAAVKRLQGSHVSCISCPGSSNLTRSETTPLGSARQKSRTQVGPDYHRPRPSKASSERSEWEGRSEGRIGLSPRTSPFLGKNRKGSASRTVQGKGFWPREGRWKESSEKLSCPRSDTVNDSALVNSYHGLQDRKSVV